MKIDRPKFSLVSLLMLGLTLFVLADSPQFSVGDRVEVDINMNSDPATGNWQSGVIQMVDLASGGYWVQLDQGPQGKDYWKIIPIRTDKWTRKAGQAAGNARNQNGAPQAQPPQAATTRPTQGTVNLDRLGDPIKAHVGPHVPTAEHVKPMIENMIRSELVGIEDNATVQFEAFSIGSPHVDNRPGAAYARTYGRKVWPVKARLRGFTRTNLGTEHEYEYNCNFLWAIDARGECTLQRIGAAIDHRRVR